MVLLNPAFFKTELSRVNEAYDDFVTRVTALEKQIRELDQHVGGQKIEFTSAYSTVLKKVEDLTVRLTFDETTANEINKDVLTRLLRIETAVELVDLEDAEVGPTAADECEGDEKKDASKS